MTIYCACGCGEPQGKRSNGALYRRGHHKRALIAKHYAEAPVQAGGRRIQVHRLRAERALGRTLPVTAVVHHADGSKRADAPLVICQDEAYHQTLHRRMRVRDAGGNPNTELLCCSCHRTKLVEAFHRDKTRSTGRYGVCIECRA